jgi:predicted HicB family RNase H-like nuclease
MELLVDKLKYKGYQGTIKYDFGQNKFYGKILYIEESFKYEGFTTSDIFDKFKRKVEIYISKKKHEKMPY